MKCIFFVASDYGLRCLRSVINIECIELIGIVTTQPEFMIRYGKGKRRHMKNSVYDALCKISEEIRIPIHVIDKMNDGRTIVQIKEWNPEIIIVSGWYHLIGQEILGIPQKGVIGLHPSLLPKYRGGAPLVWQMINGEQRAGITLFYMNEGIDTGDIIGQEEVKIEFEDTIRTLYDKVGDKGIDLLNRYIPMIEYNCAPRRLQEDLTAQDVWPQRIPDDGCINWKQDSINIYNFIRAQTKPYPGAFTYLQGMKLIIWKCEIVCEYDDEKSTGKIINIENEGKKFTVSTGEFGKMILVCDYELINSIDVIDSSMIGLQLG